jgi:hypothetical protein
MKKYLTILTILISQIYYTQTLDELNMMCEINKIRKEPKSYVPIVEEYIKKLRQMDSIANHFNLSRHKKTYIKLDNKSNDHKIIKTETIKHNNFYDSIIIDALELIDILNNLEPMDTLIFNENIYKKTKEHSYYLKEINKIGHVGKNGKLLHERIKSNICNENVAFNKNNVLLNLLIDYGVSNKGHRNNILNRSIKFVSISINDFCVVQNFCE